MNHTELHQEFDRQLGTLLAKGYPQLAKFEKDEFIKMVQPLRDKLATIDNLPDIDIENGILPFVIVITSSLIPSETMMNTVQKDNKAGVTILRPHSTEHFKPTEQVAIPNKQAYLITNIHRGNEYNNVRPEDALQSIFTTNNTPLTIDEGIAIVTHYPEFLIKNKCFSLSGSRTGTDQRVPAIWINSKKEPNLGWCWDRNPHTWLGSAYCKDRIH